MPKKEYSLFSSNCPYTFEIPQYAIVIPDTMDKKAEPFWYNIEYPQYRATLHLSYKNLMNSEAKLIDMVNDQRTLVYKHSVKADEITEGAFKTPNGNTGIVYELFGNTATWYQFYVTDNHKHFVRAALYFNTQTDADSVAPVFNFLKADAEHLIKTLNWK
ncbi:MAG: gliding motility lipoprotein GldD [Ignavibacteriae bacterium]|nr:gliding motility lipoprotein GldD [Ignavibacteriota bacterium]